MSGLRPFVAAARLATRRASRPRPAAIALSTRRRMRSLLQRDWRLSAGGSKPCSPKPPRPVDLTLDEASYRPRMCDSSGDGVAGRATAYSSSHQAPQVAHWLLSKVTPRAGGRGPRPGRSRACNRKRALWGRPGQRWVDMGGILTQSTYGGETRAHASKDLGRRPPAR